MKKIISLCTVFAMIAILSACGGSDQNKQNENASDATVAETATANGNPSYDPNRGEGKFTTVEVGEKLDVALAADGKKAFDIKCSSCLQINRRKASRSGLERCYKTPSSAMDHELYY